MSLRILLVFPQKLDDTVKNRITAVYEYPMISVGNRSLNTYLHGAETAYQLYQDQTDFTGIGTQIILDNYYNNRDKLEKIVSSEHLKIFYEDMLFYKNDVKQWIIFINDLLNNTDLQYVGIMYFMASDKTNNCKFKKIHRQKCCIFDLDEKTLLKLDWNTLLVIHKNY